MHEIKTWDLISLYLHIIEQSHSPKRAEASASQQNNQLHNNYQMHKAVRSQQLNYTMQVIAL